MIKRLLQLLFLSMLLSLVIGSVVSAQDSSQARVIVYELNVRDSYTDNGQVIGLYTQGMIVSLLGRENEPGNGGMWMYVSPVDGGVDGWVLSAYLEFSEDFLLSSVPIIQPNGMVSQPEAQVQYVEPESIVETPVDGLIGTTRDYINLRSGPGTGFDVLLIVPGGQTVVFTGRNQSGTWLQALVDGGTQGWLSYTFVSVDGNINSLPVINASPATATTNNNGASQTVVQGDYFNPMPGVVPNVTANAHQIFLRGQQLGNNAGMFSKVGDSITASNQFLDPVGIGGLRLYEYSYLQPVVTYFSQTSARDHFSFANTSLAARGGWSSGDVLNPSNASAGICSPGESPLVCEYRVIRPSVALIMMGTNDVPWVDSRVYQANMEQIIQITLDMGIIPVISTIPDLPNGPWAGRVLEFNDIIRNLAVRFDIPLWDYWLSMQSLPNLGISSDNIHPSWDATSGGPAVFTPDYLRYGYNMRNLTALMVLDAVWRNAMY